MKALFVISFAAALGSASAQNGKYHIDEEYAVSASGTIDLSSTDAKVFISGTNRTKARVKVDRTLTIKGVHSSRDEFRVDITTVDGNLKIKEEQRTFSGGIITYYKEEYRIDIEAPEGMSLIVRGDDGDYFIKNVNGRISMNVDDADVELTSCKGSQFEFRIDDGDIRMDGGRGSLQIDADDADVEIAGASFSAIDANMDDGDLILETSLADNGIYTFDSQDGLVALTVTNGGGTFDVRHDDGNVIYNGDFETHHESEDRTKLKLRSGSAKVLVYADDARVKLSTRQ